ncbi:MAG: hypothetical protein US63_C0005G0018 [Candidatus Moranbacteria bacterium GW2011_GWC2_37_8]|nr:MAG: hypothetical protein US63_C0005G0018 [Candidatus Moranbacteria bacterium GW2011_GWC2_37_8]KKQ62629.1 MAG: hypothetical protein US82_C0008G0011 [Parcubacteria group bacterium GW2011_GWC1_38_22]KKQ79460.1 MAG: hypothetical protein UT03_C0053G0005 [Candidatus Moranbacteria bacterium GW2011_GWD2_38_7]
MNIEKYKKDLEDLIGRGDSLYFGMIFEINPQEKEEFKKRYKKQEWEKIKGEFDFRKNYQCWYSEALECVRQLLPSRLEDFVSFYKSKTNRREITVTNYTVSDYIPGLSITSGGYDKKKIVGPDAAVPLFKQQLEIIKSLKRRFESSLFDIRHLVQADVFDNELEVVEELLKKGFARAAGAVAGVVLEGHLETVCENHNVKISKTKPTISDFNDALKNADVIDTATWRRIQFLGDIRNNCDHKKKDDPRKEEIEDLIEGVKKIMKNIF